jgi:hypothetical protein
MWWWIFSVPGLMPSKSQRMVILLLLNNNNIQKETAQLISMPAAYILGLLFLWDDLDFLYEQRHKPR